MEVLFYIGVYFFERIGYNGSQRPHGGAEKEQERAMKKRLTLREYVCVASMLFGMFFGAGNLIFPVSLGQQAGSSV